eukprot:13231671-Alexandrium_andersonii.AAC.1
MGLPSPVETRLTIWEPLLWFREVPKPKSDIGSPRRRLPSRPSTLSGATLTSVVPRRSRFTVRLFSPRCHTV